MYYRNVSIYTPSLGASKLLEAKRKLEETFTFHYMTLKYETLKEEQ